MEKRKLKSKGMLVGGIIFAVIGVLCSIVAALIGAESKQIKNSAAQLVMVGSEKMTMMQYSELATKLTGQLTVAAIVFIIIAVFFFVIFRGRNKSEQE